MVGFIISFSHGFVGSGKASSGSCHNHLVVGFIISLSHGFVGSGKARGFKIIMSQPRHQLGPNQPTLESTGSPTVISPI